MNNLKRFTICKLAGHKWLKISYPPTAEARAPAPSCAVGDATRRTTRPGRMPAAAAAFSSWLVVPTSPRELRLDHRRGWPDHVRSSDTA